MIYIFYSLEDICYLDLFLNATPHYLNASWMMAVLPLKVLFSPHWMQYITHAITYRCIESRPYFISWSVLRRFPFSLIQTICFIGSLACQVLTDGLVPGDGNNTILFSHMYVSKYVSAWIHEEPTRVLCEWADLIVFLSQRHAGTQVNKTEAIQMHC